MVVSLVISAVRKIMDYPRHRIYEAIAEIKNRSVGQVRTPTVPMTEADSEAFHAFCRMWSSMWGCVQHNLITVKQNGYQAANHVPRSE